MILLRKLIERAARPYAAGPDLSDAMRVARAIADDAHGSTIAYWNEAGEDAAEVCSAHLSAIDSASHLNRPARVSIKAPALAMRASLVEAVAVRCRERGVGMQFDALALAWQDPTFSLIERLTACGADLGCTLPGRFGCSLEHADRAADWGLRVRVVKGQWPDLQHPVDPRDGFMRVVDRLAGRAVGVAVATHDAALAREALATLLGRGTPVELELLYGLPLDAARAVAREMGVPVRLYIPYGRAWLPYSLRMARTNPRIVWWLLRDAVRGPAQRPGRRQE